MVTFQMLTKDHVNIRIIYGGLNISKISLGMYQPKLNLKKLGKAWTI